MGSIQSCCQVNQGQGMDNTERYVKPKTREPIHYGNRSRNPEISG